MQPLSNMCSLRPQPHRLSPQHGLEVLLLNYIQAHCDNLVAKNLMVSPKMCLILFLSLAALGLKYSA